MTWYSGVRSLVHYICQPEDSLSADCHMQPDWHPGRSRGAGCIKGFLWFGAAMVLGGVISLLG